jgi:hypothetical protein
MKVYLPGGSMASTRVYVQPGKEFPNTDFLDPQGSPRLFTVEFKRGVAKVESNLGDYLVDKGHAQRTRLIIPQIATQVSA